MDLREQLGDGAWDYFAGGAGDEITLRDNEDAWDRYRLAPRVLVDVSQRDTSVDVLGERLPHPVIVAPMAYQKHAHVDGEVAMARAAQATDSTFVLSSQTTTDPKEVAAATPGSSRWFQLYVYRDRQISLDLVAMARESGYTTLVITVDFPVVGWRERDHRSGFQVTHPVALNPSGKAMSTAELFDQHDPSLSWDDIASFAEAAQMPVLLKGVLRPDDAHRAVRAGVSGIVVSNHGGRQLDTVAAGADALGPIVDAVGGQTTVIVDGGVRRGWDVATALALGADAVMIGRPLLWGMVRGGESGVVEVMQTVLEQFDSTLALLGCPHASQLDPSYLAGNF